MGCNDFWGEGRPEYVSDEDKIVASMRQRYPLLDVDEKRIRVAMKEVRDLRNSCNLMSYDQMLSAMAAAAVAALMSGR